MGVGGWASFGSSEQLFRPTGQVVAMALPPRCRGVAKIRRGGFRKKVLPWRCRNVAVALPTTAKKSGGRTGSAMVAEGSEKIEEMDK
jgi:hypothetical protein